MTRMPQPTASEPPRRFVPYNPLEKSNLGMSIANAALSQDLLPLPPPFRFLGGGVYLIYYSGLNLPYDL